MTTLVIARHGNTFNPGDVVTRVGARTDMPLTEGGRVQGISLGKHFSEQGFVFDAVFCSCLQRTQETAELALQQMQSTLVPAELDFLREIDYGPDENVAEELVRERIGEKALADWENLGIPPDGWLVDPEGLKREWQAFFEWVLDDFADGTVLVVTSNGIARFALQAVDETSAFDLKLKTGAYGVIKSGGGDLLSVEKWNIRP